MIDARSLGVLKVTLQILQGLERDLQDACSTIPVEARVELGQVLSGLSAVAGRALRPLKTSLRDAARQNLSAQYGTHQIRGNDQTRCSVHFPRPSLHLSKNVDVETLKRELGDTFSTFFEVSYAPVKDYQERLADFTLDLSPSQRDLLYTSVDMVENTPRVKFEDDPALGPGSD